MTGLDRNGLDRKALQREVAALSREFATLGMRLRLPQLVASELTLQQLKVLTLLAQADPPLAAHAVAEALRVTPATVSGLVARLVDHGLLTQVTDPTDRRSRLLLVTDEGRRALDELSSIQLAQRLATEAQMTDAELEAMAIGLRGFLRGLWTTVDAPEARHRD